MKSTLLDPLIQIPTYSIIVPIIIGVIRFKKLDTLVQTLVLFLFIELAAEIVANIVGYLYNQNGKIYACYFILEGVFFGYYFYKILRSKFARNFILIFVPIYFLVGVFKVVTWKTQTVWLPQINEMETGSIILLSIIYYYRLLNSNVYIKLSSDPDFWIVTGIATFELGSFLPYGFLNYLHSHYLHKIPLWDYYIIAVSNLFMYGLFTIAFLCPTKSRILN